MTMKVVGASSLNVSKHQHFHCQRSAGFLITKRIKARLVAEGTDVKLQFGTMHGNTLVESAVLKDLAVIDLNGESPVKLPRVYKKRNSYRPRADSYSKLSQPNRTPE